MLLPWAGVNPVFLQRPVTVYKGFPVLTGTNSDDEI